MTLCKRHPTPRATVYACIDTERDYQEMRVVRDGSTAVGEHSHTPEEYLLYMQHYMNEAIKTASTVWGPDAKPATLDVIRKVVALGVACMEQNGVVNRGDILIHDPLAPIKHELRSLATEVALLNQARL